MLTEILISLAFLIFIALPIFYFLLTIKPAKSVHARSLLFLGDLPDKKWLIEKAENSVLSSVIDNEELKAKDSIATCNLLFSSSTIFDYFVNNTSGFDQDDLLIEYSSRLSSDNNLPTSIEILYTSGPMSDEYLISKGNPQIMIGFNSSSTTDPDILVFGRLGDLSELPATNSPPTLFGLNQIKEFILGPGVNNIAINPKHIIATERSFLTPIWHLNTSDYFAGFASSTFNKISSTTINHTLPLSLALSKDFVAIGSEKNANSELFLFNIGEVSGAGAYVGEVGAGVNDVLISKNLLYVATPKNPELEIYDIESVISGRATSTILNKKYDFDAPGGSGNGKSLAPYSRGVLLGRTLGNNEFLEIEIPDEKKLADVLDPEEVFPLQTRFHNPNESILQVASVYDGRLAILSTNNPAEALIVLRQSNADNDRYIKWFSVELEAEINDFTCFENNIYAVLQSTTTPVAKISFPK